MATKSLSKGVDHGLREISPRKLRLVEGYRYVKIQAILGQFRSNAAIINLARVVITAIFFGLLGMAKFPLNTEDVDLTNRLNHLEPWQYILDFFFT